MCNNSYIIHGDLPWNTETMAKKEQKVPEQLDPRLLAISKRIRELREKAGYTNYENFAWDNKIGRMQYWRLENNANFTMTTLFKVLDAHSMTMEDFFEGMEE